MSIEDGDAPLRIVDTGRARVVTRMREAFERHAAAHPEVAAIDPAVLDRLVEEASDRAGASLWRISLAEAAAQEYGIGVSEALGHPALATAETLIDAPAEPGPVPAPAAPAPAAPAPAPEPAETPAPVAETPATVAEPLEPAAATPAEPAATPVPEPPVAAPAPETPDAGAAEDAVRVAAVHTSGIETLQPGDDDLELRLSQDGLDVIKRSNGVAIGRLNWSEITNVTVEGGRRGLRGRRPQTLTVQTARGQALFELPGLSEEDAAAHVQPALDRLQASG